MMQLRPSSAHIWTKCAGQPRMASNIPPEESSDPAREGTCAAWVAEMVLTGAVATCAELVGETHENGWLVENDMAHRIQSYVDLVRSYGGDIHTERKVRFNDYVAGTPDCYAVLDGGVLRVDDLKYGFGIVEPYRNTQVMIYTGAILKTLAAPVDRVEIGIYQPRAWHPSGIHRVWSTTPEELEPLLEKIKLASYTAQRVDAALTAGPHCEYCPAAATCAESAALNYRNYEQITGAEQRHMTAIEASEELEFLTAAEAALKGRKTAVEAEVKARIGRGEQFPGWHMEQGAGQRRWTVKPSTVRALTGIDPEVPKSVTPAELERMGANPAIVAKLTETPRTTPRLKKVPRDYYANLFGGNK